jgi:hypothetical protein
MKLRRVGAGGGPPDRRARARPPAASTPKSRLGTIANCAPAKRRDACAKEIDELLPSGRRALARDYR